MVHIKITKGLDIPIVGKPEGHVKPLVPGGEVYPLVAPHLIALDLRGFQELKFRLLVKLDEVVKLGQPLVEDKSTPGRMFVAPAAGIITEIRRGNKRSLLAIIIAVDQEHEQHQEYSKIDLDKVSKEALIERMKEGGIFSHIYARPFNHLADPHQLPRSIFVKALESAPFMPPSEMQVEKHEREFQTGLNALAKLTVGPVHLIYRSGSLLKAFTEAANVKRHTAEGPHPVANASVHIQALDPIKKANDIVWTINAHHVVALGHLLDHGLHYVEKVISIAPRYTTRPHRLFQMP